MNNNNKKDNRKREMSEEYDNQKSNERHSREKKTTLCVGSSFTFYAAWQQQKENCLCRSIFSQTMRPFTTCLTLYIPKSSIFSSAHRHQSRINHKRYRSAFSAATLNCFFFPFTVCCSSLTDNKKKKKHSISCTVNDNWRTSRGKKKKKNKIKEQKKQTGKQQRKRKFSQR